MAVERCKVLRAGLRPYREVWELQRSLQQALMDRADEESLILCEHEPVITIGKSAKKENILCPVDELAAKGVDVFEIERGGDVTYHGPGQVVGYPILDLNRHRRDVHWYMRGLEEVLIRALERYEIRGERLEGKTGVWVRDTGKYPYLKIASLGVRLSRWVTLHGFALNVKDCSSGFSLINPCGFRSDEMTCMEAVSGRSFSMMDVTDDVGTSFLDFFFRGLDGA